MPFLCHLFRQSSNSPGRRRDRSSPTITRKISVKQRRPKSESGSPERPQRRRRQSSASPKSRRVVSSSRWKSFILKVFKLLWFEEAKIGCLFCYGCIFIIDVPIFTQSIAMQLRFDKFVAYNNHYFIYLWIKSMQFIIGMSLCYTILLYCQVSRGKSSEKASSEKEKAEFFRKC